MNQYRLHYTSYGEVTIDDKIMRDQDVIDMCPMENESEVLQLEVGETLVDEDGDTWERIA